ncbi:DUF6455 family protein [Salipiger mucosus]|uniref:DUF6455 domain-containing protein n=1 Tax=Salipiger mucosus DSM 16094 TaxID=1123237 RepID=S9QJ16_9RHOB|nr:DUF6455 family protein [Salipiger mucosus]EPX79807.1 hypothetical protein Salmuc_02569 [Salipiger mucosus DSM 16094]
MAQTLGDPARHFWMTRSVARVMGLNLLDAMHDGQLDPKDYAEMVTCCRGCALVEACESWLGAQSRPAAAPPPGCCNATRLMALRKAR